MVIGIDGILKLLPHRYPFLFVDGVNEVNENSIRAYKNLSINEPFFQGHFPNYPIMPGVLILEGLAQTACILMMMKKNRSDFIPLFLGIDKARFKKEARPGDRLEYFVEILNDKEDFFKFRGEAKTDEICAVAEFLAGIKKTENR